MGFSQRRHLLILGALASSVLAGCGGDGGAVPGSPDVLVVTIDTARADRFSYAGDSPVPTPRIDALAAEGTAFLQAVSPAPITLVAHASLLTGLLPIAHGVRNNGTYRLGEANATLAELLRGRGYRTGAFVGAAVLDSRYGLDRGFDHYDDDVYADKYHPERRGEEVVRAAVGWLDRPAAGPAFVWVHLFDPHDPYDPPEPERSRHPASAYDGEIAYADRVVGELLDGYRARGRYDRALVVLTSDHGESLGEHGEESHGVFVYDATVRVPLIVRVPGLGAGRRVETQVQLVDVVPTLAELLDLPLPEGIQGRSLVPSMRGRQQEPTPAYLESFLPRENHGWSELRGVRAGGWKLVLGAAPELYDLRSDPGETRELAAAEPERAERLQRILRSRFAEAPDAADERIEIDETARRQLAALGYLATRRRGTETEGAATTPRPDPRRMIHLNRAWSTAAELFDRGFHQAAVDRLAAILEEDPTNLLVGVQLLKMLIATGRLERAERQAQALLETDPESGSGWWLYGRILDRTGRPREALAAYEAAWRTDPSQGEARARRWELLLELGERDRVAGEAAAALDADPGDGAALAWEARARFLGTDPERLVAELAAAAGSRPDDPAILAALGDAYFARGAPARGLPHHARAQSLAPEATRYGLALARTLEALGRPEDVRHVLRNIRKRGMLLPEAWLLLGRACLDLGDRACALAALRRVSALVPGPLDPWLGEDPRRRAEILTLAGRLDEAPAAAGSAAFLEPSRRREEAPPPGALDRPRLERLYRHHPLDLEVVLAYGEACARERRLRPLQDLLALLVELLLADGGGTALLETGDLGPRAARLRAAEGLNRIGTASWEAHGYWEAVQAYAGALLLVPEEPRLHYHLGLAWERLGDFREARAAFAKTLELAPGFPRAREHLQAAERALGDRAAATFGPSEEAR